MIRNTAPLDLPCAERWAGNEFEAVTFADKRLKKRLMKITQQFASAPAANIPQACGDWSQSKAAYRFFGNEAVEATEILRGHRMATIRRMLDQEVVLAIQDTTSLNFSNHPQTEGLGPIGNNRDKTVGLMMHSVLAVNEQGLALGLLDSEVSARDREAFASECSRRKCSFRSTGRIFSSRRIYSSIGSLR